MKLALAEYRDKAGLSQTALAKAIGKSVRTIKMWEAGESFPNAESLWNISVVLGTDPNTLMGWYDTHPREDDPSFSQDELTLVDNYRNCTPQWKTNVSMTALAAAGESLKVSESAPLAAEGVSA